MFSQCLQFLGNFGNFKIFEYLCVQGYGSMEAEGAIKAFFTTKSRFFGL